jgi:hypothetical protein
MITIKDLQDRNYKRQGIVHSGSVATGHNAEIETSPSFMGNSGL